jgi:hypothetical protein
LDQSEGLGSHQRRDPNHRFEPEHSHFNLGAILESRRHRGHALFQKIEMTDWLTPISISCPIENLTRLSRSLSIKSASKRFSKVFLNIAFFPFICSIPSSLYLSMHGNSDLYRRRMDQIIPRLYEFEQTCSRKNL